MPTPRARFLEDSHRGPAHPFRFTPRYHANVPVRSVFLECPTGNVVVNSFPSLKSAATHLRALGAATRLVINHGHEAMDGEPVLDVTVFVPEGDLEVIPTPGHTPFSNSTR